MSKDYKIRQNNKSCISCSAQSPRQKKKNFRSVVPFTNLYEVIIQFAAILAVVLNYPSKFTFSHINLWTKVMIAFLPIATIGFIFSKQVKELFSIEVVAIMFIVGGIVFLIVENVISTSSDVT